MPFVNRYNRQPAPANRNSVDTARSAIDALTPVSQERLENALRVNGYPVLYYSRMTFGLQCSCSRLTPKTNNEKLDKGFPTEPGVTVLDPQGHGTDEYISSVLNGSVVYIDRYGARHSDHELNGICNPQRSEPHSPLIRDSSKELKSSDMDDPFADRIEEMDTQTFMEGPGGGAAGLESEFGSTAYANAAQGCGVCLGTGFVGGYSLVNGSRTVIDTQANWIVNNISLLPEHPQEFRTGGGRARAEIRILLPKGGNRIDALRLWNNRKVVDDVSIYIDGQSLNDAQTLIQFCDGGVHTLSFVFDANAETAFTHAEIQIDCASQPIYVEFSRLSKTENLELPENFDPQNLLISAHVPHVSIYDVLVDTTYERAWKIVSDQNLIDRNRNPYGWEAIARLVQRFELPSLLWLRRIQHRHTKFANDNQLKPGELLHNPYQDAKQGIRR